MYCCCYLVAVTVGSSHRGCSVEKDVLGDFVDFIEEGQFSSLFSIKLQAWKPAALLSCFSCEVFASAYFKEHGELPLLHCCGFVLLFFMLWYNVPLIFNHFTCYLSISRDQLSSVFSWSLTYLARALVMFLFFFFPCVTIMLHHTKFRLVPLLCTTCVSHGCIKDSSTSLFCPCYNWRWASDYTNEI